MEKGPLSNLHATSTLIGPDLYFFFTAHRKVHTNICKHARSKPAEEEEVTPRLTQRQVLRLNPPVITFEPSGWESCCKLSRVTGRQRERSRGRKRREANH